MPVALQCSNLAKRYAGQQGPALGEDGHGVSFEVDRGEFFALLGPSGCGKTTTLRIVGGFVEPDQGTVKIDGKDVTDKPPHLRSTNTVFQSYALFPHMRLGPNVSFGLKMSGASRSDRDKRASEVLDLVGLSGMEKRRVSELSGGQQQRAALARAMANRPSVLLLDEPLGALDLKLRRQMQDELVALKQRTGTTFIHVTHDQEEACAMADRIAIMDRGRIAQIDTPQELYRNPRTVHVARFINLGAIIKGKTVRDGARIRLDSDGLTLQGRSPSWLKSPSGLAAVLPRGRARVSADPYPEASNQMQGIVERRTFTGLHYDLTIRTAQNLDLQVSVPMDSPENTEIGSLVFLTWRPEDILFVEEDPSDLLSANTPSSAPVCVG